MSQPTADLDISQLLLDPDNPRLPRSVARSEEAIIAYLARETAIDDLVESIARNGYFSSEPLIVFPAEPGNTGPAARYFVAEGNRRVTALKLLHNPALYPRRRLIAEISESALHKPDKVPVIVYAKRADTLPLLGYRHITGIKPWEPLAKARYIADLVAEYGAKPPTQKDLKTIAEMVGSKPHYIVRALDTLAAYEAIEAAGFYEIEDLSETTIDFSVLLTAVNYTEIHNFLSGAPPDRARTHFYFDRPAIKADRLEKLTRWLFEKDKQGRTRLGESRNLKKLNSIVSDASALEKFDKGSAAIEIAYRQTTGVEEDFAIALNNTEAAVTEAASLVAVVKPKPAYSEQADAIAKQIKLIQRALRDDD